MIALISLLVVACVGRVEPLECPQDTGAQVGVIANLCTCQEAELQIGTTIFDPALARSVYSAVERDAQMVHGSQGGWHVMGAIRALNTRSVVSITARVVHPASGLEVGPEQSFYVQLVEEEEECIGTFPGMVLYLFTDDTPGQGPPELLACEDIEVHMCIADSGGRELCEVALWRLLPDPVDVAEGLAQECS